MTNVFIFHGTGGYPEENWFPWLKDKLGNKGFNVVVPQFPTPEDQNPEKWFEVLEEYKELITPATIIFGHSLGGTFLLRVLEKLGIQIEKAIFIATPIGILPIKNIQTDQSFLDKDFDWLKIKKNANKFFVFHSDNDPFVCLENGQQLASHLGVNLSFIPNAGHFNSASGYKKFEELLKVI